MDDLIHSTFLIGFLFKLIGTRNSVFAIISNSQLTEAVPCDLYEFSLWWGYSIPH